MLRVLWYAIVTVNKAKFKTSYIYAILEKTIRYGRTTTRRQRLRTYQVTTNTNKQQHQQHVSTQTQVHGERLTALRRAARAASRRCGRERARRRGHLAMRLGGRGATLTLLLLLQLHLSLALLFVASQCALLVEPCRVRLHLSLIQLVCGETRHLIVVERRLQQVGIVLDQLFDRLKHL